MRPSRRTAGALALSLLLHAALAVWLWSRPAPAPRPGSDEPAQTVISFEVREVPAPLEPSPSEPPTAVTPRPRQGRPQVPSAAPAAPPEQLAGAEEVAPAQPEDAPQAAGPLLRTLVPGGDFVVQGDEAGPTEPVTRGHTLRNDGSGPSREQLAQRDAAAAKQRVDGWIVEDKAELRVANGVDDYFRQLKHALEDGASKPPKDGAPAAGIAQKLWSNYRDQLARYGQTGSPSGELGPDALNGPYGTSAIAREVHRDASAADSQGAHRQMQHLRSLADNLGGKLLAVVELRQAPNGAFVDARLVTPSGNALFDAYVLATAPTSVQLLPPLPPHLAQAHPDGVRSLWSFQGLLEYRKKASELKTDTAGDKAHLAGAALLALLTGAPFEETTGDLYVMDLRDPKFRCKVQLLKLY